VKIFVWRLAQQSIPSADIMFCRNMATTNACKLCGREDSWRHSLLDYQMARCVWALAEEELVEYMNMTAKPDARRWLFTMIDSIPHAQFITLSVTLWEIWYALN
jgi:hypothetical protein